VGAATSGTVAPVSARVEVALEIGRKRTFASALAWPGWCRGGRDEEAALEALLAYGPRYAVALGGTPRFSPPRTLGAFEVVERIAGDATTDFGAPGRPPSADAEPIAARELGRLVTVLRACWAAFDAAAEAAAGSPLRSGPRGGGRDVVKIRAHVLDSDGAYLTTFGGKAPGGTDPQAVRDAFVEALGARARGELPDVRPRGGARWSARYALRPSAWLALDHAWEIQDRSGPA
jgi:hypothetical protein